MGKEANNKYLNGAIRILNGKYKDAVITLQPREELIVGRDVQQCHLIFEAPWISRLHCAIAYDETIQQYMVTDYSENGTFVESGERLSKDKTQSISAGTVIEIGEDRIRIQLL